MKPAALTLAALGPYAMGAAAVIKLLVDAAKPTEGDFAQLNPDLKRITPYSNFAEGDYVTRGDDGVHLVKNMTEDGYCAEFECVQRPSSGWTELGDLEYNLCGRYERVHWKK